MKNLILPLLLLASFSALAKDGLDCSSVKTGEFKLQGEYSGIT